jgi:hypothetical protein
VRKNGIADSRYLVDTLKAFFGEAATAENDHAYAWLPKRDAAKDYGTLPMFEDALAGPSTDAERPRGNRRRSRALALTRAGQAAAPGRLGFDQPRLLAEGQHLLPGARRELVHEAGNDPRPTCLVAGAQPGPGVAMEVLVEEDEIAPVRVVPEFP